MKLDEYGDIVLSTNPHEASDIFYKMTEFMAEVIGYVSMPHNTRKLLVGYITYAKDYLMVIRSFVNVGEEEIQETQKMEAKTRKNNKK